MIKLEEIAGYLPHGLNAVLTSDRRDDFYNEDWFDDNKFKEGAIWQYAGYADSDLSIPLGEGEIDGFIFRNDMTYCNFSYGIKPILRPLTDLTKPIMHKDVEIVPIYELLGVTGPNDVEIKFKEAQIKNLSRWEVYLLNPREWVEYIPVNVDQWPLYRVKKLIKWHFWLGDQDRFGKDIIDINTLTL